MCVCVLFFFKKKIIIPGGGHEAMVLPQLPLLGFFFIGKRLDPTIIQVYM
jgi:hypothetical protein